MKQLQIKILLGLVSIIISLVLVEIVLRILGIEYPLFYDYDPVLGNKLRPGVKGYYVAEGKGYVSINSHGLRDHEHPVGHPADTLRIAVLGDSYAEAKQVNRKEAFWAVMEKELQRCINLRGRKVEVINFGQSSFGTTQELLTLQKKAWKYSPDVVLLAFTTGNDIADNSRALKQIEYHPYHVYQGKELKLDDKQTKENWSLKKNSLFRRVIYPWEIDKLRVFQIIHNSKELFWKWWLLQDFVKKTSASGIGQEAGISDTIYREPTSEVWKEAWRVTEGLLLLMRDEVTKKGAQFYVVVLTNGVQVDPDVKRRASYAKFLGVNDLFYPDNRLQKFCQEHHIPILLLGPSFRDHAVQHKVFLHGFGSTLGTGHWNQNGHRLAGKTIAKWLCHQIQ